jgi:hypothetical protein
MAAEAIAFPRSLAAVVWQDIEKLLLVSVIGFVAIGASGALALGMGAAFGHRFVYTDGPGVTYTSARCADYREYHPEQPTCAAAADAHHFDEVVWYRIDATLLAVPTVVAYALLRRANRKRFGSIDLLPRAFASTVGAVAFDLAAGGLLLLGSMQVLLGHVVGSGQWLSAGVVAAVVFAGFLVRFVREVRPSVG